MAKKTLSTEIEQEILTELQTFPTETRHISSTQTHYYNSNKNWFYFNDDFCVLNIENDKHEFCIRIDPNHKFILIVSEKSGDYFSTTPDDFEDISNTYISTYYKSHEEYFMASTVKHIPVSYGLMLRCREFLNHCREHFE